MKILPLATGLLAAVSLAGAAPADSSDSSKTPLPSGVTPWNPAANQPTKTGTRQILFDAPTATLNRLHCHLTTLNPGQNTGEPHRHPQEEMVVLRAGAVEVNIEGKVQRVAAGGVIFFSANALENMRNVGTEPATYYVIQFYTDKTPAH